MENAENFFIKEKDTEYIEKQNNTNFFDKYLTDNVAIEQGLSSGKYFKGVIRMNPRFRYRAYVSIAELDVDVLIDSYKLINRALDGDTVLIEMLPVQQWIEMSD